MYSNCVFLITPVLFVSSFHLSLASPLSNFLTPLGPVSVLLPSYPRLHLCVSASSAPCPLAFSLHLLPAEFLDHFVLQWLIWLFCLPAWQQEFSLSTQLYCVCMRVCLACYTTLGLSVYKHLTCLQTCVNTRALCRFLHVAWWCTCLALGPFPSHHSIFWEHELLREWCRSE